jgi:dephospho-CoA kinase
VGTVAVRLGLTGGIGSGKSTVAALLGRRGASIIDADAISRSTTALHGAAMAPLEAAFGPTILTPEGALDREKMRRLIYADATAKTRLENVVHPLVQREMAHQIQRAEDQGARCIVLDVPLLVESKHWRKILHRILVVDCSEQTQMARVTQRDGLDSSEVEQILAAQASRAQRLQAADLVLFNDAISKESLGRQVQEIAAQFGL